MALNTTLPDLKPSTLKSLKDQKPFLGPSQRSLVYGHHSRYLETHSNTGASDVIEFAIEQAQLNRKVLCITYDSKVGPVREAFREAGLSDQAFATSDVEHSGEGFDIVLAYNCRHPADWWATRAFKGALKVFHSVSPSLDVLSKFDEVEIFADGKRETTKALNLSESKPPKGFRVHRHGGGLVSLDSHVDDSVFVGPEARIERNSNLSGNVRVLGPSRVYNSTLSGEAYVDSSTVTCSEIFDFVRIEGGSLIQESKLRGQASVRGRNTLNNCKISDQARVSGSSIYMYGALAEGSARVSHRANIYGATLKGRSCVEGSALVEGFGIIEGCVSGRALLRGDVHVGVRSKVGGNAQVVGDVSLVNTSLGDHSRVRSTRANLTIENSVTRDMGTIEHLSDTPSALQSVSIRQNATLHLAEDFGSLEDTTHLSGTVFVGESAKIEVGGSYTELASSSVPPKEGSESPPKPSTDPRALRSPKQVLQAMAGGFKTALLEAMHPALPLATPEGRDLAVTKHVAKALKA